MVQLFTKMNYSFSEKLLWDRDKRVDRKMVLIAEAFPGPIPIYFFI